MKHLQATKITRGGQISLGKDTMLALNLKVGDKVQIVEDGGNVRIVPLA